MRFVHGYFYLFVRGSVCLVARKRRGCGGPSARLSPIGEMPEPEAAVIGSAMSRATGSLLSIRVSGGRGEGGARCAGLGRRGCRTSSSPSRRGRPQGAWSRPACSGTDAAIEPRSWRRSPSGPGSYQGTRSSRRLTSLSLQTVRVIWSAAPFARHCPKGPMAGAAAFWRPYMLATPTAGLVSSARLLLPRAIRGAGRAATPGVDGDWRMGRGAGPTPTSDGTLQFVFALPRNRSRLDLARRRLRASCFWIYA
jgi:hypothetical protein